MKLPNECSGCGACVHLCPTQAISFAQNAHGFYYPDIDRNKCLQCGVCKKKCPVLNAQAPCAVSPVAYAAQNLNEQIRTSSSSGGIFTLLAEHVIRQGGIVVGCVLTQDCYAAEHKVITNLKEINALRGSKYIQSRVDIVFPAVKEALENGQLVLFSGTPCQVAGLHAYLTNTNIERLITIDIICHGVPSPVVWKKYVCYWESIKQSKVVSVQFRNKELGWRPYSLVLTFDNGEVYTAACTKDLYCKGYVADYYLRDSCYDCRSKGEKRMSDITLGDFWGIQHVCVAMDDNQGTSLALLNTEKGKALFRIIQDGAVWQQVEFSDAIRNNPSYHRSSTKKNIQRSFLKRLHKKSIIKLLETYCSAKLIYRIIRKLITITAW